MIIKRLCMILVDMFLPDSTAVKSPAIDMLTTAIAKATIAGINGLKFHTVPAKKGARIGKAPMIKNTPVVLRDSFG
jgi:hypothetical protein